VDSTMTFASSEIPYNKISPPIPRSSRKCPHLRSCPLSTVPDLGSLGSPHPRSLGS
jgi:hypothetical protein